MKKVIIVENLTKQYKLYKNTKERLFDLALPNHYGDEFYALSKVNFEAEHGEVIGFIGTNGSGKSTLSNIIAGIVPETSGNVTVRGQVSLIAVAAGLKNDLTGRDNIELKLLMLGFSKTEIKKLEPDIIDFSELEKFIDQPVKSYSSGMKSRLGFAISVNVNPDILIIDEALSVGDKAFAEKSLNKMKEFKQQGKTMIFVSHSIGQMRQFCEKILWLEYGMVKEFGKSDEVLSNYENFLKKWKQMSKMERGQYKEQALLIQSNINKGLAKNYDININDFYKRKKGNSVYQEMPVSLLGRLKPKDSYIYKNLYNLNENYSSDDLKSSVYYIKRKAVCDENTFYLISTKPSGLEGVIGWMKSEDVSVHPHIIVDYDKKEFYINGDGEAYNMPWGRKDNCIFNDLSQFAGEKIEMNETNLIGKHVWYKGLLQNKKVWILKKYLKGINE